MHVLVSRIERALGHWWLRRKRKPRDETLQFTHDQIRSLADRGQIYLARCPGGQFSTIIARDFSTAVRITYRRAAGEEVIGRMGAGFLPHLGASTVQSPAQGNCRFDPM